MADDSTKVIISIETILRNLERTLRGLSQVEKQLKSIASVKVAAQSQGNFNKAAAAAQKLQLQQQRLAVQSQELSNRQERARLSTLRLAQAQERLNKATTAASGGRAADAHVREFRIQEREARRRQREVDRINRDTAQQAKRNERERTAAAKRISDIEIREAKRGADALVRSLGEQQQAATALSRRLQSLGNGLRSIGQGAAQIGLTLSAAVTAPLVALGVATVSAAVTLDSLTRGLTAITGSSEEASVQLGRLIQIAKLPGIGFEEAIQGSIRLQAVGFSALEAERALVQFSNAIALTGGGRDELARVTIQLGQLAAKGKVLSQDLRPIIEAAPAVGRALLQAFGTVNSDDIQELGLSSREFLDILVKQLGQLPRAAAGAKNAFENFRDSLFRAAAVIGTMLLPKITALIDIVGPVVARLAEGFNALPKPLQDVVLLLGLVTAAAGPMLFIFGQLTTGIGRAIVGLVQLNALGLLPTISNLRLLGQVMVGTASLAQGAAATAAVATGGWIALALALGAVVTAIIAYTNVQEKSIAVDIGAAKARTERIAAAKAEIDFLEDLVGKAALTAKEQERLVDAYGSLEGAARGRILAIGDENSSIDRQREKLAALIEEKRKLIVLDEVAGQATIAVAVDNVTKALNEQVKAQQALNAAKQTALDVNPARARFAGEREDVFLDRVATAAERQVKAFRDVADAETDANEKGKALEESAKVILELSKATGLSVDALLRMGKASEETRKSVERFAQAQESVVQATDNATEAMRRQIRAFSELSDAADAAQKTRSVLLSGVVDFLRENTDSIEDAKKGLQNFIQLFPELGKAIEKERRGRAIEDVLNEMIGKKKPGRGQTETALRTAQRQLAKALEEIAQASAEQLGQIEKLKNDRLLQENENAFRLNLRALTLYLSQRAILLKDNLQLEINEQQKLVDAAIAEQQRFLSQAGAKGIKPAEQTRLQAGAKAAEQKAVEAKTKILELTDRQKQADEEATQALAEHAKQQESDLRQLQIEYGELTGRIEDALNAATDEKFRDTLQQLALDQETLNKRIAAATKARRADELAELTVAQKRNQSQIDAIELTVEQERVTNRLAAINEFVNRAKERQSELEKQITNDVDFRGLSEEQTIARRLAGEERVKQALLIARDIAQGTIDDLRARLGEGFPVPQALLDFIRQVNIEVQSLGKLTFTEQFRLAEKEFNRIQDELQDRIADVERAIRSRDIAEIQGRLIIRKLNGEYVGDLERQLALLQQIAEQSNDEALRRQAASARQATADIRAAAEETENFNRQLKSVAIDSFADSLSQLFKDLRDNTESAAQDILNFFNNILNRVNDFIAENLAREIAESLFPDPKKGGVGGLLDAIKGLFGIGGNKKAAEIPPIRSPAEIFGGAGGTDAAITAVTASLATASTAAGAALTTGGTAAATALATGVTAAGATLAASITAAAAAFSAAVIAAGAAFAAAVSASAALQTGAGAEEGFAIGDIIPAAPRGRLIRVAEAGHDEAVLTTDPKHALRQVGILREFLKRTRGLSGHLRMRPEEFAEGGLVSARETELNLLGSIQRAPMISAALAEQAVVGGGGGDLRLRQVFVDDQRDVRNWINSPEGEQVLVEKLTRNRSLIRRLAR